jgi:hypothetical protein
LSFFGFIIHPFEELEKRKFYEARADKESIIEKTYSPENLPSPLFSKEGCYSSLL